MSGAGPFYSTGQGFDGQQANAPGDGQRALSLANTYLTNPSQYTWYQTFNNGTSLEAWDPEPLAGYHHNMRAAWCYMTMPNHDNNTAWRNAARDMLLSVAQHSTHDFSNSNMYSNRFPGFAPNPIFTIAGNMIRALKTYDMLGRDTFTSQQRQILDQWFYGYANWIFNWFHREANNGKVPNIKLGDTTPASWYSSLRSQVAFNGGPYISGFGIFTNRVTICLNAGTLIAAYLKYHTGGAPSTAGMSQPSYGWWTVDEMLDYAAYSVWTWLRCSLHPLGFTYDHHRAQAGNASPAQGWMYSNNEVAGMVAITKTLSLLGDNRGWNRSTTDGWTNTEGSPNIVAGITGFTHKNMHYAAWMHSRYVNDGWGRVVTGGNGVTGPLVPDDTQHDCVHAAIVASRYPSDSLLSSAWRRSGNGFPGYGPNPQSQGSFDARDGEQATYLGLIEVGGV